MRQHTGFAGEARIVVSRADGSIKTDTGYQKNLILNQGLDFFGGGKGASFNEYCAIGAGNSEPNVSQTTLDSFIAVSRSGAADTISTNNYIDAGDGLYKTWKQRKYIFENLGDVNISELGLVSTGTSASNYNLTTRMLVKIGGVPTSISLKTGETLHVYYKIYQVFSVADISHVVNILDGDGAAVPHNVVMRMAGVGGTNIGGNAKYGDIIGSNVSFDVGNTRHGIYSGDIGDIYNKPSGITIYSWERSLHYSLLSYVNGSYKRVGVLDLDLTKGNGAIRSFLMLSSMGFYQMRFGAVADDAPIVKTSSDTLSIPIEFSWGRYEGAL